MNIMIVGVVSEEVLERIPGQPVTRVIVHRLQCRDGEEEDGLSISGAPKRDHREN